jgi:hypothetical protein
MNYVSQINNVLGELSDRQGNWDIGRVGGPTSVFAPGVPDVVPQPRCAFPLILKDLVAVRLTFMSF